MCVERFTVKSFRLMYVVSASVNRDIQTYFKVVCNKLSAVLQTTVAVSIIKLK